MNSRSLKKKKTTNKDHPDYGQCFIYDRHVSFTIIFCYYKFIK